MDVGIGLRGIDPRLSQPFGRQFQRIGGQGIGQRFRPEGFVFELIQW